MIGKKISHYKILKELGRGGMGVVYLAEDTKLKRKTALKFLPSNALIQEEDKIRFIQEAQAAASLNHTNIATVYGIDEHEGEMFIAMEYIEGQTLQDKIKSGPLKLKEAIDIAIQIAQGLHVAHEQGIVHRDIKSANIMLDQKGQVKIMDFGLAKVSSSSMVTKEGTTLGTVAYMSPEQTQGEAVDHRTDIWSFGVVLYEMITCLLPFKGDYEQAMMYSIINENPEPITGLRTGVPLELERIIFKLLAKNQNKRYQHIDELPVDLESVDLTTGSSHISRKFGSNSHNVQNNRKLISKKIIVPIIVVTAFLFFLVGWLSKSNKGIKYKKVSKFTLFPKKNEKIGGDARGNIISISPDGEKIVYVTQINDQRKLYLRKINEFTAKPIEYTDNAEKPFFSPDGSELCFFANGKLKKVSLQGDTKLTLCEVSRFAGGSWGDDGNIIYSDFSDLFRISASGGIPQVLTTSDSSTGSWTFMRPEILPGSNEVLYTDWKELPYGEPSIGVFSIESSSSKTIIENGTSPHYSRTGHITFGRNSSYWAVSFDLELLKVSGPQVPILDHVSIYLAGAAQFRFSLNGNLIYIPSLESVADQTIVFKDRSGKDTVFKNIENYFFGHPRFSPTRELVALDNYYEGKFQIYLIDIERGTTTPLTFDNNCISPCWSPDGRFLTFSMKKLGLYNIYLKSVDSDEEAKQLFASDFNQYGGSWTSDGTIFTFYEKHPITGSDIWIYTVKDSSASAFLNSHFEECKPNISPDGNWITYQSNKTGKNEVYIDSFPDPSQEMLVSTNGGTSPIWSANGSELFYREEKKVMGVSIIRKPSLSLGKPKFLFGGNYTLSDINPDYAIHPDGDRFIMIEYDRSDINQINVVINWFDELKSKFENIKD